MTGSNAYGQLGTNDKISQIIWTQEYLKDTDWAFVECGWRFTYAIKTDGTLWVTGANTYGQLGLGDHGAGTERIVFTQIGSATNWLQACAGGYHGLAVKTNGTLWATGRNNYGQLGLEDITDRDAFTQVTNSYIYGSSETISTWLYVVCGALHSMAFGSYEEITTVDPPEDNEPQVWTMDF